MDAQAIQETIDELATEARLARAKGEIDRAEMLSAAAKRVEAEYLTEQSRPTAMRSLRRAS